jgi:hypothetical protein
MTIKILSNPHHFVQEATQAGIYVEELIEASECIGKQQLSILFIGKSMRGKAGSISSIMIDNWLATFQYSKDKPDEPDSHQFQFRSILPSPEYFKYLEIIRKPIDETEVISWDNLPQKELGDKAISIGITKGIRNSKSLKTLLSRMKQAYERRKNNIWNKIRTVEPVPEINYNFMNIFQIREECAKRNIPIRHNNKAQLIKLIEEYNLEPPLPIEESEYMKMTKNTLQDICKDRGFILYNKLNKDGLVELIKKDDQKKQIQVNVETGTEVNEECKELVVVTTKEYTLKLKDNTTFVIPVREDGMIDATSLCKAGGSKKLFSDYRRLKQTKVYLEALQSVMGIPITLLIETKQGGDIKKCIQGTWVHKKVALHMAQWISPYFSVKVSGWLDELFTTGSVVLERPIRNITDMSQIDIEAEIMENVYDWSKHSNCNTLYIIYIGNGLVKIGTTDGKIDKRIIKHTSCESDYPQFRLIESFEISSRKIEGVMHQLLNRFKTTFHRQKEIFKPPETLTQFVESLGNLLKDNDHKLRADKLEKEVLILRARVAELEKSGNN